MAGQQPEEEGDPDELGGDEQGAQPGDGEDDEPPFRQHQCARTSRAHGTEGVPGEEHHAHGDGGDQRSADGDRANAGDEREDEGDGVLSELHRPLCPSACAHAASFLLVSLGDESA